MTQFLLINASNIDALFNIFGVIQLGLILVAFLVGYPVAYFLFRKSRRILSKYSNFGYELLHKIVRPLVITCLLLLSVIMLKIFMNGHELIFVSSAAILGIIFVLVNALLYILDFCLQKSTHRKWINYWIKILLFAIVVLFTTNLSIFLADYLGLIKIHFGKTQISLWDFFREGLLIGFAIVVMLIVLTILESWIKSLSSVDGNLKQLLSRISKILIIVVGVFMVLPSLGFDLTVLSIFGASVGFGFGIGLQKIASNFLSGFIILLDKSVKMGDRLIINGVGGVVTKITTRYVVMQGFDGSEMLIPNEKFITDTVINQTYSNSNISVELVVSVGYSSDLVLVLDTLRACIKSIPEINPEMPPALFIQKLNDSGIDIFMRVWPLDSLNTGATVRNKLNIAIIEAFKAKGIEIPFPKRDVTILK